MSEILRRGGVTELLFETITRWVGHLPGGLAVSTVLTSAVGASITGSSVANAASMAVVAIPPMLERGYERRFTYGLVAASGTLGIMIPPSIPMLLYGEITEESIGKLFIAGIIPGLLITALLVIYAVVVCVRGGVYEPIPKYSWSERWQYTLRAVPALLLPFIVVGGIYAGIFTPTEAAAIGVADDIRGQVVKAFIVSTRTGDDEFRSELQDFTKQRLSAHEYPRIVAFADQLPKTPAGKVNRKVLRDAEQSP